MDYIIQGIFKSMTLIIRMDAEIWQITIRSLAISLLAVCLSTLICIPVAIVLGLAQFRGKKVLLKLSGTMMSMPSILVGLLVFLLLARRGPFGSFELLFTRSAMVIAQAILVCPLIFGLVFQLIISNGLIIKQTAQTLGANKRQTIFIIIKELRANIVIIVATAFGRAISEVGAVMMVGGNIKGQTRVMTTAIALNNSMGDYAQSIALGFLLLFVSLFVNLFIYKVGTE